MQCSRLALAMNETRLDQTKLAAAARVDQTAISRWLRGERDMAALQLVRVAHAVGVRLDWLLSGHEPKAAPFVRVDPGAAGDPDVHARALELLGDPARPPEERPDPPRRRARR